jgi:autotransporter-associated beta strand protein
MNMKSRIGRSLAFGIFLIGVFSVHDSRAQSTNAYWDVNGTTAGEGGSGTFSSSGVLWTTNSDNATANTGGPTGGGLFAITNGTTAGLSGNYTLNFGGTAGAVKQGGAYEAVGVNFLTSGYSWWVDANAARTITTTNGVNLNGNSLTLSNGTTGVNSFTFAGNTTLGAVGITGITGASLSLKNNAAYTAGSSSCGVYLSGGTISSNIGINVEIGTGSKLHLGTQSSLGATIAANIANNSASGVALNITNSGTNALTLSGAISGANGLVLDSANAAGRIQITGLTNSFGGGISLGSGVLYFNKFGVAGQNSSLGTNGTVTMAGAGTLRWTGSSDETSDKTISLTGTTGSYNLLANGATNGSLTLSGNINSTGAGAKTLTFAGYNTNTLTLNGVINENGGVNSVVIGASSSGTVVLGNASNSFSGPITITNATAGQSTYLSTTNIGNANANSALGKNGTINIGSGSATAFTVLKYTGTGETSDKVINLVGTLGGATLDQSGTGPLKLTTVMTATGAGAKMLYLAGSTTGSGELAAGVSDLGGNVISLKKSGTGTWTLSGSNSYSGDTTVSDGTLALGAGNINSTLVSITGSTNAILKLKATTSLASKASFSGDNSSASTGTLDLNAAGDYTFNSYGPSAANPGLNMAFTNSSGSPVTVTFTNSANYITDPTGSGGGKSIWNRSANLTLVFSGKMEIGSTATNSLGLSGDGNFILNGSVTNSGTGIRGLNKVGAGTASLNAANSYNGPTVVGGGTLQVGTTGTLPTASSITVSSGATLKFNKSSDGISTGPLTVAGTLDQNLITITSSGAVDLTGSTLKVNGTPTASSYTLVSGTSLTGTPTLSPAISGYSLSTSGNSLLLVKDKSAPTITVTPNAGGYVYSGSFEGPGTMQVNAGGSTGTVILSYTGTTSAGASYGPSEAAPTLPGSYYVTATVAADSYYFQASSPITAFTIRKVAITLTAAGKSKAYGAVDPALTYAITSGALVGSDALAGSLSRAVGENAGTYAISSTLANANYDVTFVPADLTITAVTLDPTSITVTPPVNLTYDGNAKGHTATATGVGSFTYSYAGVSPTVYAASSVAPTDAGTYTVTATSSDSNYSGSKSVNFTIQKATLTPEFIGNSSPTYNGTAKSLNATTTPVTTVNLTYDGSVTVPSSAGIYSVVATVNDANYQGTASTSLTIGKAAITVTAVAKSKKAGEQDPVFTYAITSGSLVGTDSLSGSLSRVVGEAVGAYDITLGSLAAGSNYDLTYIKASFEIQANGPTFSSAFGGAGATAVGADGMANLLRYAMGANSASASVVKPVSSLDANSLSITAIVRINDTKVSIVGQSATDLAAWSTTPIVGVRTTDQTGATVGETERQVFSVSRGGTKTFLRLVAKQTN